MVAVVASLSVAVAPMDAGNQRWLLLLQPMGPVVAWPVKAVVAVLAAAETSMWHLGPPVLEGETDHVSCWSPCKRLPKIAKTAACASTSARSRTSDHCTTSKCISSYVTLMH